MRIKRLLIASVILNLLMGGMLSALVYWNGGFRYLGQRFGLVKAKVPRQPFQIDWEARYRNCPRTPGDIVFAGDSVTWAAPYGNFFGNIRNRGIGGETTVGLLGRVDEIAREDPAKIFLMIGSNDLARDHWTSDILDNYRQILVKIKNKAPKTMVYIQSIPPRNAEDRSAARDVSGRVLEVNTELKSLAAEFGYKYIDLMPFLGDERGQLRPEFSEDGLHLTWPGYLKLMEALAPFVSEPK
jgi:lysophospholipase L1-like esterase